LHGPDKRDTIGDIYMKRRRLGVREDIKLQGLRSVASEAPLYSDPNPGLRIAIDVSSYLASKSGVGVSMGRLVDALLATSGAERYTLCAVSVQAKAVAKLRSSFSHNSICIRRFPLKFLVPAVDRCPWLTAETIFGDTDVFHAGPFLAPVGRKAAIVVTINDLTPVLFPELHLPSNRYSAQQIKRRAERADLVIVPSESTANDLERLDIVQRGRVRVIPLAADETSRPAGEAPITALPGFALDHDYVLSVGALEPRKNLPRLFEAFRLLRDRYHIPHKLVVAGPGGWKDQGIFQSVRRWDLSDAIVFAGYVPREVLHSLYRHAALLVYASLYEGFGLPPLEAMARGCPVAVSRTSSLPEVVGEAGIYFNPLDVEEIAQAIHRVLSSNELRARLIQSGLAQSAKFSWKKTAEATRRAYKEAHELWQHRRTSHA
jgi:glycosyltransferase involved in cell wall biosynthesis